MNFEEKLREKIKTSDKSAVVLYKQILSEIQQISSIKDIKDAQCHAVIKKFLKDNREMQSYLKPDHEQYIICEAENKLLKDLLPTNLSLEEIENILQEVNEKIISANSDNMAMSIAMKHLGKEKNVDGNDVKKIVVKIRNNKD